MKGEIKKSNKSTKGYSLPSEQMLTMAAVSRLLVEAECYLEQDSTDNTMEHFDDFMTLYTDIHRALEQADYILRVHNLTERARVLAEDLKNYLG